MKKIFLFVFILSLISCNDDLFQIPEEAVIAKSENVESATRAGISEFIDFNPLQELQGIPLNILNLGNQKNKFLSAKPTTNVVCVYNQDDNSQRQRWYIEIVPPYIVSGGPKIILVGGNNQCTNSNFLGLSPYITSSFECSPYIETCNSVANCYPVMIATVPNTSYYHIGYTFGGWPDPIAYYYLQPTTITGETLKYLKANNSDLAKWELCPVGDFEVKEIEYFKPTENFLTQNDQRIDVAIIDNQLETQSTYHFVATGSYQESSNFSETEGVRVQVSETARVGLPVFGTDLSISVSKEKSWTFGESESKTVTVQHSVDVFIPAYSKVMVEAFKKSYTASLRYIATLKQISTGKTFRVKGMWDGVTTSEIYIKMSKLNTAELLPDLRPVEEGGIHKPVRPIIIDK